MNHLIFNGQTELKISKIVAMLKSNPQLILAII